MANVIGAGLFGILLTAAMATAWEFAGLYSSGVLRFALVSLFAAIVCHIAFAPRAKAGSK